MVPKVINGSKWLNGFHLSYSNTVLCRVYCYTPTPAFHSIPLWVHFWSVTHSIPWSGMDAATCTPFHGVSVSGHTPGTLQHLNFPSFNLFTICKNQCLHKQGNYFDNILPTEPFKAGKFKQWNVSGVCPDTLTPWNGVHVVAYIPLHGMEYTVYTPLLECTWNGMCATPEWTQDWF